MPPAVTAIRRESISNRVESRTPILEMTVMASWPKALSTVWGMLNH